MNNLFDIHTQSLVTSAVASPRGSTSLNCKTASHELHDVLS